MSKTSRSAKFTPGILVGDARDPRVVLGNLADHAHAQVARVRQVVGDDLEAFGRHVGDLDSFGVGEVVDRGDVDTLREPLLAAQEHGDVVPHRAVDVHHRLAV